MPLESSFPALYHSASRTSAAGQQWFLRATRVRLVALCIAALAIPVKDKGAAIVAAAGFVVALAADAFLLIRKPERSWYGGRAGAESAKTVAWRYSVGGNPFAIGTNGDALLRQTLAEVLSDLRGVELLVTPEQLDNLTPEMRAARAKPLGERKELYARERLGDQQRWYATKAEWNRRRARFWSTVLVMVEAAAVSLAFYRIGNLTMFDWLGVASAIGAAVAAWLQAKQHQNLTSAYSVAAMELTNIKLGIATVQDEAEWASFVADAEEAMSREHTMWRARRS